MSSGKKQLVYLSATRLSAGADTVIEDQGDLQINPGIPLQTTAYKNSSKTAQGNEGWSATMTVGVREPLGTGQALLFDAIDNDGDQWVTIKSATTGAIQYEGPIKLTITQIGHPINGESEYQVEMRENGTMTRSVVA